MPLHTGVAPPQSAFAVQRTQVAVVVRQTGVAPVHFETLPAEHWPHAPVGSQAGVAPPQSTSPAHARHVFVPVLHTGVMPLQSALATHVTQVPEVVLQSSVEPVQAVLFVAEQPPHAPVD